MKTAISISGLAVLALLLPSFLCAIPAFPGATGWGGDATGGRGGQVVHVTSLNSYGTGTLQAALAVSGAKIIVFDVGGVIDLQNSVLTLPSNTTIAGQTAPGGITLKNGSLYSLYGGTTSNMIVRFLRVRRSQSAADGDCIRLTGASNWIVDHCSFMWNSDETIDISYNTNTGTFQNCIVAEPGQCSYYYCGDIGCGNGKTLFLGVGVDGRITLYKNLLAHSAKRTPYLTNDGATPFQGKTFELVNNVFYNDFQGSYESFDNGNTIPLNLIGNYYMNGPNASYPTATFYAHSGNINPPTMVVHCEGNLHPDHPTITLWYAFFNKFGALAHIDTVIPPRKVPASMTLSAPGAYGEVLAVAGPLPRDSADTRICRETRTFTGSWMDTCLARDDALMPQVGTKPVDSDNDGMPNSWETSHGLNPNSAADATTDRNSDGYTNIEEYINALADSLINAAKASAVEEQPAVLPAASILSVRPQPFQAGGVFDFDVQTRGPVSLRIFDLQGRLIGTLTNTELAAGSHQVTWNGRNSRNSDVPAGAYLAVLKAGKQAQQKMVMVVR